MAKQRLTQLKDPYICLMTNCMFATYSKMLFGKHKYNHMKSKRGYKITNCPYKDCHWTGQKRRLIKHSIQHKTKQGKLAGSKIKNCGKQNTIHVEKGSQKRDGQEQDGQQFEYHTPTIVFEDQVSPIEYIYRHQQRKRRWDSICFEYFEDKQDYQRMSVVQKWQERLKKEDLIGYHGEIDLQNQ